MKKYFNRCKNTRHAGDSGGGSGIRSVFDAFGLDIAWAGATGGPGFHWFAGAGDVPASWASVSLDEDPTSTVDIDNDGLSDAWERQQFGSIIVSQGGGADSDGDGLDDQAECAAGTNPLSPVSVLRPSLVGGQGKALALAFPTVLGRWYQVERSTDLGSFAPVGAIVYGTGGQLAVPVPTEPATAGTAFYRLAVGLTR